MRVILLSLVIFICAYADTNARNSPSDEIETINAFVVGIGEKVSDKFLHEYANTWWQWTKTMSRQDSPVIDRIGDKCHANQSGSVWFLAGG